ncbi:MAG: diguanylate cyclase [Acidobacteriota bacterium]
MSVAENEDASTILDEVLENIDQLFRPVLPYNRISFARLTDDATMTRLRWVRSAAPAIKINAGYASPMVGSDLEKIIESGQPRILNDLEAHLQENPQSESTKLLIEEGMRSSLTCPLIAVAKPVGFLFFSSTEPDTFQVAHQQAFLRVSEQLSTLIEKSLLYEELVEVNWQLGLARDAFEYQSRHDALTRLWNRAAIMDIGRREHDRSRREQESLAVMMVDIDSLKKINDTYSQEAGDEVLRTVADRVAGSLRSYEAVGRYGDATFLISLYSCDDRGATKAAERISALVGLVPIETCADDISATISIGVAIRPPTADSNIEEIIRAADEALSKAKSSGPGNIEIITPHSTKAASEDKN